MMAPLAQMSVGNESLAIFFEEQRLDEELRIYSCRAEKPNKLCWTLQSGSARRAGSFEGG